MLTGVSLSDQAFEAMYWSRLHKLICMWVDASYAVHADMRSHTGGMMTLGNGAAYCTSHKQKLNTRSSTESELVAVNDVLGQVLWTRYFLEAQGYPQQPSKIYQDNKSAILLEQNGRASSRKRTRHIDIRYFLFATGWEQRRFKLSFVPPQKWLLTSSPSHCKAARS